MLLDRPTLSPPPTLPRRANMELATNQLHPPTLPRRPTLLLSSRHPAPSLWGLHRAPCDTQVVSFRGLSEGVTSSIELVTTVVK